MAGSVVCQSDSDWWLWRGKVNPAVAHGAWVSTTQGGVGSLTTCWSRLRFFSKCLMGVDSILASPVKLKKRGAQESASARIICDKASSAIEQQLQIRQTVACRNERETRTDSNGLGV